jgi:hypothetical protein
MAAMKQQKHIVLCKCVVYLAYVSQHLQVPRVGPGCNAQRDTAHSTQVHRCLAGLRMPLPVFASAQPS